MFKRTKIIINGLVQGIGFRNFLKRNALNLNLRGYAKNNKDSNVELIIEGSFESISKMIDICKKGSPTSRIDKVLVEEQDYKGEFNSFKILWDY